MGDMDECIEWSGHINGDGYGVMTWKGRRMQRVHRIVFYLYNGYLPEAVRHKCDNRACINIDHLEGGTRADNSRDAVERERMESGENRYNAKLKNSDIPKIKKAVASGKSQKSVAKKYDIDPSTISRIISGKRWRVRQ